MFDKPTAEKNRQEKRFQPDSRHTAWNRAEITFLTICIASAIVSFFESLLRLLQCRQVRLLRWRSRGPVRNYRLWLLRYLRSADCCFVQRTSRLMLSAAKSPSAGSDLSAWMGLSVSQDRLVCSDPPAVQA